MMTTDICSQNPMSQTFLLGFTWNQQSVSGPTKWTKWEKQLLFMGTWSSDIHELLCTWIEKPSWQFPPSPPSSVTFNATPRFAFPSHLIGCLRKEQADDIWGIFSFSPSFSFHFSWLGVWGGDLKNPRQGKNREFITSWQGSLTPLEQNHHRRSQD